MRWAAARTSAHMLENEYTNGTGPQFLWCGTLDMFDQLVAIYSLDFADIVKRLPKFRFQADSGSTLGRNDIPGVGVVFGRC